MLFVHSWCFCGVGFFKVRLNSKCLMFRRDLKVRLSLSPMTLDYLSSEEDNTKNRGCTGMFYADFHFAWKKNFGTKGMEQQNYRNWDVPRITRKLFATSHKIKLYVCWLLSIMSSYFRHSIRNRWWSDYLTASWKSCLVYRGLPSFTAILRKVEGWGQTCL